MRNRVTLQTLAPTAANYHAWHERRVQTTLAHLSRHLPGGKPKLLDLGHDCKMGARLTALGVELTGNLYPGTPRPDAPYAFAHFDLEHGFPFSNCSFDVVTAFEVIEHVVSTPRVLLREASRVLKANGILYLGTPNVCSWAKVRRLLSQVHPYDSPSYGDAFEGRHHMSHVYEYETWTLQRLVEAEGFQVIECATWDPYDSDPRGLRDLALRVLVTGALLATGYVKDGVQLWRRRGHQIGLVARRME